MKREKNFIPKSILSLGGQVGLCQEWKLRILKLLNFTWPSKNINLVNSNTTKQTNKTCQNLILTVNVNKYVKTIHIYTKYKTTHNDI